MVQGGNCGGEKAAASRWMLGPGHGVHCGPCGVWVLAMGYGQWCGGGSISVEFTELLSGMAQSMLGTEVEGVKVPAGFSQRLEMGVSCIQWSQENQKGSTCCSAKPHRATVHCGLWSGVKSWDQTPLLWTEKEEGCCLRASRKAPGSPEGGYVGQDY